MSPAEQSTQHATTSVDSLVGVLLQERWRVIRNFDEGKFGSVFEGRDTLCDETDETSRVAIKFEHVDDKFQLLRLDILALSELKDKRIVTMLGLGRVGSFRYIVMPLLGRSLASLRETAPLHRFSLGSAVRVAIQMLKAIRAVHDQGFLHRDVKPANFVFGRLSRDHRRLYVIDFGMARRYVSEATGRIRKPREDNNCGFRGTFNYASLNAHQHNEMCRADDVWSVFYIAVEMIRGTLPWRDIEPSSLEALVKVKRATPPESLLSECPLEYYYVYSHLNNLSYAERPNYERMIAVFERLLKRRGLRGDCDSYYDWENRRELDRRGDDSSMEQKMLSGNMEEGNIEKNSTVERYFPVLSSWLGSLKSQMNSLSRVA